MHSPESTQAFAHLRAASLPSPWRRMSMTPAITSRGSPLTPPASVTGQASTHLPHWVQASAMAATRSDNADSNVTAGSLMTASTLGTYPGTIPGDLIAIQAPVSCFKSMIGHAPSTVGHALADEGFDRL